MKILRYIGPADYITLLNGLLGFLAIMYIVDKNYRMASILILAVILLDGLDGWIARFFKSKKQLGKYLDSISDTVSFSFAPAVMIYSIFYDLDYTSFNYWPNAAVVLVCFVIVGFGMLRLAWFVEYGQKFKYFQGLPTPALALFVIILLQPELQVWLGQLVTLMAILAVTFMTIMDFEYPKLHSIPAATVVCIIIIALILVLAFDFTTYLSTIVMITALCLLMIYILSGPFSVQSKRI